MHPIFKLTFFDSPILFFEELESTNDYLKSIISLENQSTPMLILADFQTKGRGQFGHHWQSSKAENLIFSFSFRPEKLALKNLHLISESVAIEIVQVVNEILSHNSILEKCQIKWPNDLILNNKKIGGILVETVIKENIVQSIIVGIGLNVLQENFSSDIPNASSLKIEYPQINWSREDILSKLIRSFEDMISNLESIVKSYNHEEFNDHLYHFNQSIKLKKNHVIQEYLNLGIDSSGHLNLRKLDTNKSFKVQSSREFEYIY